MHDCETPYDYQDVSWICPVCERRWWNDCGWTSSPEDIPVYLGPQQRRDIIRDILEILRKEK